PLSRGRFGAAGAGLQDKARDIPAPSGGDAISGAAYVRGGNMTRKTLIFIPTYNESANVGPMCEQILALGLDADLLFMDDGSPDGTGDLLDALAAQHRRVRVVHRAGKSGIGSAHLEGIALAYREGYDRLV